MFPLQPLLASILLPLNVARNLRGVGHPRENVRPQSSPSLAPTL